MAKRMTPREAILEPIEDSLQAAESARRKGIAEAHEAVRDLEDAQKRFREKDYFGAIAYLKHAAVLKGMAMAKKRW